MSVKINIKPLSINEAFQGRRFKTEKYKKYEKELLLLLPKNFKLPPPPYYIIFEFGFSNKASDLDNPIKVMQDILQKKYKFNDKDIYKAEITKKIVKKGGEYILFNIKTLE